MNALINKFLSAGNRFLPKLHLKQLEFTCIACDPFTKNKEWIKKLKETEYKDIFTKMN